MLLIEFLGNVEQQQRLALQTGRVPVNPQARISRRISPAVSGFVEQSKTANPLLLMTGQDVERHQLSVHAECPGPFRATGGKADDPVFRRFSDDQHACMSFGHCLPLGVAAGIGELAKVLVRENSVVGKAPHIDMNSRDICRVRCACRADCDHVGVPCALYHREKLRAKGRLQARASTHGVVDYTSASRYPGREGPSGPRIRGTEEGHR